MKANKSESLVERFHKHVILNEAGQETELEMYYNDFRNRNARRRF